MNWQRLNGRKRTTGNDCENGGGLLAGVFVVAARWRRPPSAMAAARYRQVKPSRKRELIRLARCAHNAGGCIRPSVVRNTRKDTRTHVISPRRVFSIELSRRTGHRFESGLRDSGNCPGLS